MTSVRFRAGRQRPTFDASAGIRAGLALIAADADQRVPVDTGRLRDSQVVKAQGNTGGVGYTDSKAVGAHENLTAQLQGGRQPKFLESALTENAPAVLQAIADDLRKGLT